jgi:folate-binding protein YgfZ
MSKPFYVEIGKRGFIFVKGEDSGSFLQKLLTSDILSDKPVIYSCLLTPQGKFLHDFFVIRKQNEFILECEPGERAQDLFDRLILYKMRARVDITLLPDKPVYTLFGTQTDDGYIDPRNKALGFRTTACPEGLEEKPKAYWDTIRIEATVPDGSLDILVEKDTLLDCNLDKIGGVSFDKGCYVGQEVTARTKYRGLVKKHLYTISGSPLPDYLASININGKLAGQMRSSCGDIGIAQIKDSELSSFQNTPYTIR